MGQKMLMKGNEAIAEAAIQAGCRFFFGYPITPQNQIPEYMSKRLPKIEGGCFLQAESEVAAINMVYGAAGAGGRVMTSSSSPGISLKQEGISYIVGAELPCVIVNMVRGGPGLGSIQPAQSDYYQSTRGGGHGDYRMLVLAPSSVQEAVELTLPETIAALPGRLFRSCSALERVVFFFAAVERDEVDFLPEAVVLFFCAMNGSPYFLRAMDSISAKIPMPQQ